MSNILFVTGTDTGCGKTTICSLLISSLISQGHRLKVCKPVETGCERDFSGELIASDSIKLWIATNRTQLFETLNIYRYAPALSPYFAAREAGEEINLNKIAAHIQELSKESELVVVEGAGGLLVPLNKNETFIDLIKLLRASVLLVVGSRLGAINHSLLTLKVLRDEAIPIIGYVINEFYAGDAKGTLAFEHSIEAVRFNREQLMELCSSGGAKELFYLPFKAEFASESLDVCTQLSRLVSSESLFGFCDFIRAYFKLPIPQGSGESC